MTKGQKVEEKVVSRALAQSVPVPMVVSGISKKVKNKEVKVSIMRTKMPVAKPVKTMPVEKPVKKVISKAVKSKTNK